MLNKNTINQIKIIQRIRPTVDALSQACGTNVFARDISGKNYGDYTDIDLEIDECSFFLDMIIKSEEDKLFSYKSNTDSLYFGSKINLDGKIIASVIVGKVKNEENLLYIENLKRIIFSMTRIIPGSKLETDDLGFESVGYDIPYEIITAHENYEFIKIISELQSAYKYNDKEKINTLTMEFFYKLIKRSDMTNLEYIKYYILMYYGFMIMTLLENGFNLNFTSVTVQRFVKSIYDINNEDELMKFAVENLKEYHKLGKKERHKKEYSYYVRECIRIMQLKIEDHISIEEMANKVKLSVRHLARLIKKETGKSYTDIYNEMKIDHSKVLLRHTKFNMVEIASRIGVNSQGYYSILFKKYTGISPSEYRNKNSK